MDEFLGVVEDHYLYSGRRAPLLLVAPTTGNGRATVMASLAGRASRNMSGTKQTNARI